MLKLGTGGRIIELKYTVVQELQSKRGDGCVFKMGLFCEGTVMSIKGSSIGQTKKTFAR